MLPDSKKTFAELAEWFIGKDSVKTLPYSQAIQAHLKLFNTHLGKRIVADLLPAELESLRVKLSDAKYSPSYIDQTIDMARYMVRMALDNDLIGGDCLKAFRRFKGVLKRGANARQRVLSYAEYIGLHAACPAHLKGVVALGFLASMRKAEILGLRWEDVDLASRMIRLSADVTKEGMPKSVPLTKSMRGILMKMPDRGRSEYIFTFRGKPMGIFGKG